MTHVFNHPESVFPSILVEDKNRYQSKYLILSSYNMF